MRKKHIINTNTHAYTGILQKTLLGLCVATSMTSVAHAAVGDADDDGVADAIDVAPCNGNVTSVVAFPGENQYATFAFEDQWPSQGDYDFNDLVLPYNVEMYRNAAGNVARVRYVFAPKAMGALFNNGLAVHLPVAVSGNVSAQIKLGSGSFSPIALESGESEVVVRVAESIRATFFGGAANQVNTDEARASVTPTTAELVVDFATPTALNTAGAPFDVFIFRTGNFSHQIHQAGSLGTDKMDQTLWGSLDDNTNFGGDPVSNGTFGGDPIERGALGGDPLSDTFEDKRGVPFVLNLPANVVFPQENRRIDALFPRIVDFAVSNGVQFSNFHSVDVNTAVSFRNALAATPAVPTAAIRDQSCVAALGTTSGTAATSCLDILQRGTVRTDGVYFIDPDGAGSGFAPQQVLCDMTRDGGGWTMLYNSARAQADNGFWFFPLAQRFSIKGTPALDKDYYSGNLYTVGREYRDEETTGTAFNSPQLIFRATSTGINPNNMNMLNPVFLGGNSSAFEHQFQNGWSASDFESDLFGGNCVFLFGTGTNQTATQHYHNCWVYNLAHQGGPHGLNGTNTQRITRWARW